MRIRPPENRGAALASTLLIILFLTLFAFTLANLATFDLRTSSRNAQKQKAFEAAQAGLDAVTAELSTDPTLGKAGEVFAATMVWECCNAEHLVCRTYLSLHSMKHTASSACSAATCRSFRKTRWCRSLRPHACF